MKKVIVLFLSIFLCIQCSDSGPEYITVSGPENLIATKDLVVGERLASSKQISLAANQSLLLSSSVENKIYKIIGPTRGTASELVNANSTVSFAKEYMSFLLDNMNSNEDSLKDYIYGGVSRAYPGEWVVSHSELIVSIDSLRREELTKNQSDELIYIYDEEEFKFGGALPLDSLRHPEKDIYVDLRIIVDGQASQRQISIASSKHINELRKREAKIRANRELPSEVLLDFYLKNKLYKEAKSYGEDQVSLHPVFARSLKYITE